MKIFKKGDKIRRITESLWPEDYGVLGQIYIVDNIKYGYNSCVGLVGLENSDGGADGDAFELVEYANELPEELFEI